MGFGNAGDDIVAIGETKPELGGSEYYHTLERRGDAPPALDFELEVRTMRTVLGCIRQGLLTSCHDVSKGGLGVAVAEMAIVSGWGASLDLAMVPAKNMREDELLFSESNSRFLATTKQSSRLLEVLSEAKVPAARVGTVGGSSLSLTLNAKRVECSLSELRTAYLDSLQEILEPWQK